MAYAMKTIHLEQVEKRNLDGEKEGSVLDKVAGKASLRLSHQFKDLGDTYSRQREQQSQGLCLNSLPAFL